jgi:hypothetical protein
VAAAVVWLLNPLFLGAGINNLTKKDRSSGGQELCGGKSRCNGSQLFHSALESLDTLIKAS